MGASSRDFLSMRAYSEQEHQELPKYQGYTKVVFNQRAKERGSCYYVGNFRIPIKLTKSVERHDTEFGSYSSMWIEDWFYEKNKQSIKNKLKE